MKTIQTALLIGCLAGMAAAQDKAFMNARIIDGTGKVIQSGTLLVRGGKVAAAGSSVKIPDGVQQIDITGKTIIPGLINAHGHVNALDNLGRYARFGVTTVFSLGGEREVSFRDSTRAEQQTPSLNRARLFICGPIPASNTAEEGRKAVDELAAAKVDLVKIRVDDNLGAGKAMSPEVYGAIIDQAHKKGLRVAVHIVKLADAKGVLKAGADFIAHSVRDADIDDDFIALMKKNNAPYSPTLLREVSTFAYADKPAFLSDPFLLKDAADAEVARAKEPQFIESMKTNKGAAWYREHMAVAMRNVKRAQSAGIPVVMGTDTGPAQRFQGYFEHLELEYMVNAGLTPMQSIVSATGTAARALKVSDVGTLEPGKWADFLVLAANPLDDIKNTRKLDSVWIAGAVVPGK
jgi:imidazolonepropionase-like amidohydrolase